MESASAIKLLKVLTSYSYNVETEPPTIEPTNNNQRQLMTDSRLRDTAGDSRFGFDWYLLRSQAAKPEDKQDRDPEK